LGDYLADFGSYEICDLNGNVVEYMDLLGNFSKEPTVFAMHFNQYVQSKYLGVRYGIPPNTILYTSIVDFPSRYFMNKKIVKILKEEEYVRFKLACSRKSFVNMFEKIIYKHYVNSIFKKKLKRAKVAEKSLIANNDKDFDVEEFILRN